MHIRISTIRSHLSNKHYAIDSANVYIFTFYSHWMSRFVKVKWREWNMMLIIYYAWKESNSAAILNSLCMSARTTWIIVFTKSPSFLSMHAWNKSIGIEVVREDEEERDTGTERERERERDRCTCMKA